MLRPLPGISSMSSFSTFPVDYPLSLSLSQFYNRPSAFKVAILLADTRLSFALAIYIFKAFELRANSISNAVLAWSGIVSRMLLYYCYPPPPPPPFFSFFSSFSPFSFVVLVSALACVCVICVRAREYVGVRACVSATLTFWCQWVPPQPSDVCEYHSHLLSVSTSPLSDVSRCHSDLRPLVSVNTTLTFDLWCQWVPLWPESSCINEYTLWPTALLYEWVPALSVIHWPQIFAIKAQTDCNVDSVGT